MGEVLDWRASDDDALFEGVPGHLKPDLQEWAAQYLRDEVTLRYVRRRLRIDPSVMETLGEPELVTVLDCDHYRAERFLKILALLLDKYADGDTAPQLGEFLDEGGSAWCVVQGGIEDEDGWSLERRVDDTVREQYSAAVEQGGSTGVHLAEAWHAAFGINPDGTKAYDQAVKAVEAELGPLVSPKDRKFTLGKGIKVMEDGKEKFWFTPADPVANHSIDPFLAMCGTLWRAQERHGDDEKVAEHSVDEGRSAVHLAVAIVALAQTGSFTLVGADES